MTEPKIKGFVAAPSRFDVGNSRNSAWEPFEDPLTPLQEIRSFFTTAFTARKLSWLAVRVLPVAMLAIAAVIIWPRGGSNENESDVAIETVNTLVPGRAQLAEIEPGLTASKAETPRLFVETVADRAKAAAVDGNEAEGFLEDGSDGAETGVDTLPAAGQVAGEQASTTVTTGSQTTRPSANGSTTRPTTAPPTTPAPNATQAPATQAPTTAPPTTQAPTTQAPTTQAPTTQAPTTQPPTTQPPTTQPPSGNCSSGGEFEWIFRDDFNGSSVSGDWSQYNSSGNAGFGLRRPSANSVYDGKLVITAQMENGTLVSGGMSNRIDQKYGKWIFRVRTDNDASQAVSGVVLTWPQSGVHPRDGENNIYETLVQTPNRNPFYTFIHKPYGSHSDQEYKQHHADGSQWQTMTMEWTPSRITIIRDGTGSRDVWTVNETGADLIPDVPHHLTIQLDAWKHSIGATTRMEVDFVEIYKYCG